MAIRRPFIDMIDRGLDPKVPHKDVDKRGIIVSRPAHVTPVIAVEDMKENLLANDAKEIITENSEKSNSEETISIRKEKSKEALPKKLGKLPKPV